MDWLTLGEDAVRSHFLLYIQPLYHCCLSKGRQPLATRRCSVDDITGATWEDLVLTNCSTEVWATTDMIEVGERSLFLTCSCLIIT